MRRLLFVLFLHSFGTFFTGNGCINKTGIVSSLCCADFYLKEGECTPCLNGYYGPNCIYMCPYPYFGRRCLEGPCQCPKENCDAETGCRSSIVKSTRSTDDHTEEQLSKSTKINHFEQINQKIIEGNERRKTNRTLFADDFLSTVLLTFAGTAISCFLLFAIGSQIKSTLQIKRRKNYHHTPELHVCTQGIYM